MMSTLLGVGLAVTLRDNFSSPALRISATSKELKTSLRTLAAAQSNYFRTLGMTGTTFAAMGYGLGRIVGAAAKYKYEMISVGAVTQATRKQLEAMDKTALKLSNDTIFQAKEIASAMKFMGMAGLNAKQILGSIPAVVNLAGATDTVIGGKGGAADIMTNIMHTFGLVASESGRVADLLTAATVKANLNINDLGESLKYVGATARGLQIPLKDTSAAIMLISNSGIQGSMAGVALENALRYFTRAISSSATKRQANAMASLGLSMKDFVDEGGNLVSIDNIFEKIGTRMKGLTSIQRTMLTNDIFGVRGQRAARIILDRPNELRQFQRDLSQSGGFAQKIMDDRMDSLLGHIWRVRDSLKSLGISFTESITPLAKSVLKAINMILQVLHNLMDTPIGKVIIGPAIIGFIGWKVATLGLKLAVSGLNVALAKNKVNAIEAGISGSGAMNSFTSAAYRATSASEALNMSMARGTKISKFAQVTRIPGMMPMVNYGGPGYKDAPVGTVAGKKIGGNIVYYNPKSGKAVNVGKAYTAPEKGAKGWIVGGPKGDRTFSTREQARAYYDKRIQGVSKAMKNPSIPEGTRGSWFITTPGGNVQTFSSKTKAMKGISKANTALGAVSNGTKAMGFLKFLGPIAGWIGKIFGFLTGPWGMAIMTILTFLPGLIDLVKDWFGTSTTKVDKQTELLNALVEKDREILNGALVRGAMRLLDQSTPDIRTIQTIQNDPTLSPEKKQQLLEDQASTIGKDAKVSQGVNNVTVNVSIPGEALTSTIRTVSGEVVDAKFDNELNK